MKQKDNHKKYLKHTFKLALKGKNNVSPNPLVGCVIVKNDNIIAEGYHKRLGAPHAEIEALSKAGKKAKGANLYVNLEPCCHYGKTPPCTEAIINAGIKKVIFPILDPNPLNNGKGMRQLMKKGIEVYTGILENEARQLNKFFIKFITKNMPYVCVKIAQSLDGKIGTRYGESKWITNDISRRYSNRLRSQIDAILVGKNTIIKDDPLLSVRYDKYSKQPAKIILDRKLNVPLKSKIFSSASPGPVIMVTTEYAPKRRMEKFRKKQIEVIKIYNKKGKICLKTLMKKLAKRKIASILIEGGGEVVASAFEEGIVDKVLFFISPKIIGGRDAVTSVEGDGIKKLSQAIRLKQVRIKRFGEDILIEGYPKY